MLNAVLRAGQRVGLAWRKSSAMRQHGPFGTRVLYALGLLRIELGDLPGAIRVLSRAVARAPTANVVRFSLATAHYQARQFVEASRQLLVLVNETGNPRARALLAMVLGELGLVDEAENHASEAAAAAPWDALAIQAQVKVFARRMRFADAVGLIEKFLTAGGHDSVLASRLPYYLTLQPDAEPEHMARACALVSTKLFLPAAYEPVRRQSRRRSSARPRIGYVSGDLRKHVIVRFLEHVLRHHDRSEFEVFLYDNTASPDAVNERLRAIGHRWRTIVGQDDDEAARRIAADEIDLLVDLSGHTDGHRLGVFARRPAQVQATWLGFPGSTGLATMDWRIVDRWTVPDGSAFPGTERPLRLPTVFACFQPQDSEPLRAAATGGPVFGSVHKLEKLNADVVTVWSRILVGDPSARLLIARDQFDPLVARWILREFRERGIDAGRIEIRRLADGGGDYDSALSEMDVVLDAFPWSGHATCCYALAAGVPVVTLAGGAHAGRMVASVLAAASYESFIANTRDEYVNLALTTAMQVPTLRAQRLARAASFRQSRACDGAAFTLELEAAFRSVLPEWRINRFP